MIKSFKPFLAVYKFDGVPYRIVFKCPCCGSDSCVKLDELDTLEFYSGIYMCSSCGMSVFHGKEFNYYNDCFKVFREPIQLSLF